MKKLMIIESSSTAIPILEAAHNLGLYVITCDYLPDNIAHKFSDEYCNVSIIDKEATYEAAKRLKIDGIVSFACDPGVATAAYIAEKMGLPFQCSYRATEILQDKGLFRHFLTENGEVLLSFIDNGYVEFFMCIPYNIERKVQKESIEQYLKMLFSIKIEDK